MNAHKTIFCLGLITFGAIVGGSLSFVTGGGAVVAGIMLGCLLFCIIQGTIARRGRAVLPYDQPGERHQANNHGATQTQEVMVRGMQNNRIFRSHAVSANTSKMMMPGAFRSVYAFQDSIS